MWNTFVLKTVYIKAAKLAGDFVTSTNNQKNLCDKK